VISLIVGLYYKHRQRVRCEAYISTAEQELSRDNFDQALEHLKAAKDYCGDKDIEAREVTVKTFKIAAGYDQVRLVKDPNELTKIDENLRFLRNLLGDTAELRVLQGIFEELSDRPQKSLNEYQEAVRQRSQYANAFNSWGYTIYKWRLGGSSWSGQALEKFQQAIQLKRDYAWPHINTAVVHLELAANALDGSKVDLDGARSHLPNAKTSLEMAEKLLPDNPRVLTLWGHYHVLEARIFNGRGLTPEANQSFYLARQKSIEAKNNSAGLADARLLLGSVYLELGMPKEAVLELRDATKLDDMNVTACARLIYALSQYQPQSRPDEKVADEIASEVKRGLNVIETLRQRFMARSLNTNEPEAREWLAGTVKAYEPLELALKSYAKTKSETKLKRSK
jgi:tetratricopeptide (TPR) repeat protein